MPQNSTDSLDAITSGTVLPAAASTSARVGRLGSFLVSFSLEEDRVAVILSEARAARGAKDPLVTLHAPAAVERRALNNRRARGSPVRERAPRRRGARSAARTTTRSPTRESRAPTRAARPET